MFYNEPRVSGYPMIAKFGYPVPDLPDFAHPYSRVRSQILLSHFFLKGNNHRFKEQD